VLSTIIIQQYCGVFRLPKMHLIADVRVIASDIWYAVIIAHDLGRTELEVGTPAYRYS